MRFKLIRRVRGICVTRTEDYRREFLLIRRVGEMFCLKTKTHPLFIDNTVLARQCAIKKITGVELNAGLGGHDSHFNSARRLVYFSSDSHAIAIDHPAMIVAASELNLLIFIVDAFSNPDRRAEIEGCVLY